MRQEQSRSKSPAARILSLALALCMIAAFVPAFTLTAGATNTALAGATTGVISTYDSAAVLWHAPVPNKIYSNAALSWDDWTAEEASGYHAVYLNTSSSAGNVLKFQRTTMIWSQKDIAATVTSPGYGANADSLIIEWTADYSTSGGSNGRDTYYDFTFYDTSNTKFAAFSIDYVNGTYSASTYKIGKPDVGADCAIVVTNNNEEGTYQVDYLVGGSVLTTETYSGTISGFKYMTATGGGWTRDGNYIGFGDLTIAGVYSTTSEDSVQAALDYDLNLPLGTSTDLDLPASVTDVTGQPYDLIWSSDTTTVIADDGTYYSPDEVTDVVLTATTTVGDATITSEHTVKVFPATRASTSWETTTGVYDIDSTNLITDAAASFETDGAFNFSGWTSMDGSTTWSASSATSSTLFWSVSQNSVTRGTETYELQTVIPDGDYALGTRWNDASGGYCTIHNFWSVDSGESYYFSFYAKSSSNANSSRVIKTYFTTANDATSVTESDSQTYTASTSTDWQKFEYIFTAPSDGYISFVAYNLGQSSNAGSEPYNMFDNFEMYDAKLQANTSYSVTRNYYLGSIAEENFLETVIKTVAAENTMTFDAYYSSENGSNELYCAEAKTYTKDTAPTDAVDVVLTPVDHWGNYETNSTVDYGGNRYIITDENIVPNGDFSHGMNGWYSRANTTPPTYYSAQTDNVPSGATYAAFSSDKTNSGASSTNSIKRGWAVESGDYYYNIWVYYDGSGSDYTGLALTSSPTTEASASNYIFLYDKGTNVSNRLSTGWNQLTGTFTATESGYVVFHEGWDVVGLANVEIYPVVEDSDASVTVTVNYQVDGTTVEDLSYTTSALKGTTISTDAVTHYAYKGKYYKALSQTESVPSDPEGDVEIIVTLSIEDESIYAPTSDFSYNFYTGEVTWASDKGYENKTAQSATISIGWGNYRETIMTYDIESEDGYLPESAVLNVYVGYANNASSPYTVYAIDASKVDTETPGMTPDITGYTWDDRADVLSILGATEVGSTNVTSGQWNTVSLDLSNVDMNSGTLALLISSSYQVYTESTITSNGPYLSDVTSAVADVYTVKYVDTSSTKLDTTGVEGATGTYSAFTARTQAYAGNITCPYVPIPYFEGYVFTDKSVDGTTITLTYTKTSHTNDFFTNVENDTTLVSLNMLGAHDAFTVNLNGKYDAAAIARGEDYASYANLSTYQNLSKTQSMTAYELLDYGVRYFDIRLSRSDDTISSYDSHTTNGVFYTTHNSLSDEFRPIAYTIGQWAKEHPGEVLILDFQEVWDGTADGDTAANGNICGNTSATWQDVYSILEEAGITDFVRTGNESIKSVTYGDLTLENTEAGIVLFGRANAKGVGKFNYRGLSTASTNSPFDGRLYSNYCYNVSIGTSYSDSYIQGQVDVLDDYQEIDGDVKTGDNPVNFMVRVMQAQSETKNGVTSSLIEQASSDNSKLLTAITSSDTEDYTYSEWLTALPIIMINGVGSGTDGILAILQSCNETAKATINYTVDGTKVAEETRDVMVGTIFTENQYTFVNGADGEYYVNYNYTTKPYTTTVGDARTITVDNTDYTIHDVVYVPYSGASTWTYEIPVTTLGNVYTADVNDFTASGTTYYENTVYSGNLTDDGAYNGLTDFGAMTWETTNGSDRVGVAILTKPDADPTADYYLTATFARNYGGPTVNLYAIDYTTFKSITSLAELKNYFVDANYVGDASSDTTGVVALDEEVIDAISTDKVVILGAANGGLYGLAGSDMEISTELKDYGIDLIDGAQIRIGTGATEEALAADSGLRFIADVSLTDTLAYIVDQNSGSEGYEIGIAIYDGGYEASIDAEEVAKVATGPVMTIPMTTAQKDADGNDTSIYTVAITNIDSSNYNRIYIAVPYVTVGGNTYYDYTEAVARTPYEVAAGILVTQDSSVTDGNTTYVYASSDLLIDALNLYVNLTGARINLKRTQGEDGSYTYSAGSITYSDGAEVFFSLTAENTDGKYVITLTPRGDAKFSETYAVEKFRVNNATATSFIDVTDGTVTLDEETGNLIITITGTGTEITAEETE